jgi:ribosomal protein L37AE/L43A
MIAGAALQKDSQALRDSIRGNVKVSCFTCGAFYYTTAAQIRTGTHPCRCGAGPMLTANLLACSQLQEERLGEHPDLADAEAGARRGILADSRRSDRERIHGGGKTGDKGSCQSCGRERPGHVDEQYWYCRGCGCINDHGGTFRASPFSTEVEAANGLARSAPARIAVPVAKHRERVAPMETAPDLPF